MDETGLLDLIVTLNTGPSQGAIRYLNDAQWCALGALVSQWLDANEDSRLLDLTDDLRALSRPALVGAIVLLLATGQLRLEITLPKEALTDAWQSAGVGFEMGIAAVDLAPECSADEAAELHRLVLSKRRILESAVARVERVRGLA